MSAQEDDWEYEDEDGEDYSWEYEEDEEEAKDVPEIPKETPKELPKENGNAKTEDKAEEIQRRRERIKVATPEPPRRRERITVEDPEPPSRLGKSDRNDILEQMKRLQEGMQIDVDEDSSDYSLSDSDEPVKPRKPAEPKVEEDDLDLSDMDLLDPFGSEPVPLVPKKDAPTNGHKHGDGDEDKKKHRKHKKKSRHADKFEKFKKLEQKDEEDEINRSKKIHVRSKDPMKIARQFEKGNTGKPSRKDVKKPGPKPPVVEVNKICKICGKEPYLVEKLVAEKSWWHKNCFRCAQCNKILTLDTYASHQGVIYCKPHHKDLFKPKAVTKDSVEEIMKKNIDFSCYNEDNIDGNSKSIERHQRQQRRMETIVRENKPVELEGVVKSKVDDSKWEGLDKLDVGSKFMMFEKAAEEKEEHHRASDRYGIMEKLKRLQAGEDVSELLAEIDDEMPSDYEEEEEDPEDYGLTEVEKKAKHAERLFNEESKKDKLMMQRKKEIKALRERLMAGTRDSVLDSFDELNHRKIKKTEVDVRSANAKKFMDMFNKGEVPEGMSASDRTTLEKEAELQVMRSKKRGERDFFQKLESGELKDAGPKEPKLLIGKLKMNGEGEEQNGADDPECATLSKKFSFFENFKEGEEKKKVEGDITSERLHAAKECKASSVLNKFKDMEQRAANGEDDYVSKNNRPAVKRFTPPRKLGEESGSEYSDSDYSDSEYSESEDYSSDSYSDEEGQDKEYLRNVREAARAKALRAKFEEWEATVGEDGGYTNLVDEDGHPLETASKLKNRFEQLAIEKPAPQVLGNPRKHQVKRFKPKEAYEYQMSD